jgi:hypothetical protein
MEKTEIYKISSIFLYFCSLGKLLTGVVILLHISKLTEIQTAQIKNLGKIFYP